MNGCYGNLVMKLKSQVELKNYKVWQDGFHPVILDTLEKMEQRVNYVHYNPVEAEIVFHERDYVNSSYRNYEEDNSVFCNVNVEPLG